MGEPLVFCVLSQPLGIRMSGDNQLGCKTHPKLDSPRVGAHFDGFMLDLLNIFALDG